MLFAVGVCLILYYSVSYLYVSCKGSITSFVCYRLLVILCGVWSERFPLPLGARDGLRYFIVGLPYN